MLNCKQATRRMSEAEDRPLDLGERLELGLHLAMCQGCRNYRRHLRVLRTARLVKFRKEGKEAWYSLDDDHVVKLMNQGLEHVLHG